MLNARIIKHSGYALFDLPYEMQNYRAILAAAKSHNSLASPQARPYEL